MNIYEKAISFARSLRSLSLEDKVSEIERYSRDLQRALHVITQLQHAYKSTLEAEKAAFSETGPAGQQDEPSLKKLLSAKPSVRRAALAVLYHQGDRSLKDIAAVLDEHHFPTAHTPDRIRTALWPLREREIIGVRKGVYGFKNREARDAFGKTITNGAKAS